jgi:glycosyltransferase involved in cell wall biosynthesis
MAITAVIITKNEAHIIGTTLATLAGVVNQIIIVDSGSTDNTVEICKTFGATIIETTWDGYGANKNKGIDAAANDWILNIDADEALDGTLKQSIKQLQLKDLNTVYKFKFKNFFCGKHIRFGEWAGDWHVRLFNRQTIKWNNAAVHEALTINNKTLVVALQGNILHYTTTDLNEYKNKTLTYAQLNAKKYFLQGKKANFIKLYIAPIFTFLQHYIFRLGFLDGKQGFVIAKTTAWYTHLKYNYLKQMHHNN